MAIPNIGNVYLVVMYLKDYILEEKSLSIRHENTLAEASKMTYEVKVPSDRPDNRSSILGIHEVERKELSVVEHYSKMCYVCLGCGTFV